MLCPSGWSIPKNEDWEPLNGPQWRNRPDDEFSWDGTNASGLSFAPDFDPSEGSGPVSVGFGWTRVIIVNRVSFGLAIQTDLLLTVVSKIGIIGSAA